MTNDIQEMVKEKTIHQSLKKILIVDDSGVNRAVLSNILAQDYQSLFATNGQEALDILYDDISLISAVMLDLIMPKMDGYTFLEIVGKDSRFKNIPIIVTTGNNDIKNEIRALKLGAWDFVSKPYNAEIIAFRLKNAITRSQLSAFNQLKYLAEYDSLTNIYNKSKMFSSTKEMLDENAHTKFVFFRYDIYRFQLINSFFGTEEGDKLLIYIANKIKELALSYSLATYGRIESDIFCFCLPYEELDIKELISNIRKSLLDYNPNYDIVPAIGVYIINDLSLPIENMFNRASLAAKKCKGNYVDCYAFYNESMSLILAQEQIITNEMNYALENNQFEVYYQPKYNLLTNLPNGAEGLVRWIHPLKGVIVPSDFIPIFERNGFIIKLDYYVWERVCKQIRSWLDQGIVPQPISVNISRVNLYNPRIVEVIIDLVKKYNIDPKYLNLELTETAYTDNPIVMSEAMTRLQKYGFIIMMDDFGSGYSSLNVLKDIAVDMLKIDMRFLSETRIVGRGENIIASAIRMAKWLNIPVIAEGVERLDQVEFLRSVGCDYAQGYYYAKPMPIAEYEAKCVKNAVVIDSLNDSNTKFNYDDIFSFNPQMNILLSNIMQAIAVYEFSNDNFELISVNNAYYDLFGQNDKALKIPNPISLTNEAYHKILINTFKSAIDNKGSAECDVVRICGDNKGIWVNVKLKHITSIGEKHILLGSLTDISIQKEIDYELQKYRNASAHSEKENFTMMIVDDSEMSRVVLKGIFDNKYTIIEANNGEEALNILKNNKSIDIILLDIIMPMIDGNEFLKYRKGDPFLESIPVIMITSDDSLEQQINTLNLGANDYIIKPFIPEIVIQRVKNVVDSHRRFRKIIKEYNTMSNQAKLDPMTGLINRFCAEESVNEIVVNSPNQHVLLLLDIDNFKYINEKFHHSIGDKVLKAIADQLRLLFRQNDLMFRMGGDEFAVLINNISPDENIVKKAQGLLKQVNNIIIDKKVVLITCSIGVAVYPRDGNDFETLYRKADEALYDAKDQGKNTVSLYQEKLVLKKL